MPLVRRLTSLWRNLRRSAEVEQDLDGELRSYLEQLALRHEQDGMSPENARRAARLEFGGMAQVKEQVREARAGSRLEEMRQDLRYGLRTLRKNGAFTSVAVMALALGIGACTAMFSVAYGILLHPLPYPEASRLAVVCLRYYPRDFAFGTISIRDFETWRAHNHAFEEPSLFSNTRLDIGGDGAAPEQVKGAIVTAGFFPTLRTAPLLGRYFAAGDDQPGRPSLIVIGESLWRRRFGARRDVVGSMIRVGGTPYTIVGVMPRLFRFPGEETEAWTNLKLAPSTRFGPWFYRGIARLKPGVTMAQAQQDTNAIGERLMQQNAFYKRLTMPLIEFRTWYVGEVRPALLVLMGAVGLVLLVAVVNVANLLLARGTARDREMALRLSLGAGRGRLVQQVLLESLLLASAGGAAGIVVAYGAVEALRAWNPGSLPLMDYVHLDMRALLFTLAVSLFTGVLFGLYPALQGSRTALHAALQDGGRTGSAGRRRTQIRAVLVVAEISLSVMLLVGAGLFLRSLDRLQRISGGFSGPTQQILSLNISPGDRKYQDEHNGVPFYEEVLRRVKTIPGVESAAISDSLPPDRQNDADSFAMEGQALAPGEINPIVSDVTASADYFRTLGIPLLRGRFFDEHDTEPVAIVSQTMERRFFRGSALDKRIKQSSLLNSSPWLRIVGVVGDVKYLGRAEKQENDAAYYMLLGQSYVPRMYLTVRTTPGASTIAGELRHQIQTANPAATVSRIATMEQSLDRDVAEPRFHTAVLALFAITTLLMASVGIYGLISFSVAQRTQEIGVRIALGARTGDVLRLVVRQALLLALAGIAVGTGGALALTRLLQSMLFGTSAKDPFTFTLVPLALLTVVLLAAAIPARRAARISPVIALRYE